MKVLMLGWELPPHHTGGLGVVCYQMSKHLAARDVDIEFILPYCAEHNIDFMKVTPATPLAVEDIARLGGIYDSEKYRILYADGTSEISDFQGQQNRYVDCVSKLVEFAEFDIIHAHDWLTFKAAMAAKMVSGKPLIVHVHTTEFDRAGGHPGNPIVHDIEYSGLMMADKIFAISQNTKDVLTSRYGINPDHVQVVHNSVEVDQSYLVQTDNVYKYLEKKKAHGYKVVLNLGRLTIQKGVTQLLHAAAKVIGKDPKVIFLIVGNGDQYHELIELGAHLGISENVILTGDMRIFNSAKAWRDAFHVADLFIMPSVNEPFGITALESIILGVPVMISKQSGVSEVLRNALKFDFWDTDKITDQLVNAVNSPALLSELLKNSKNEVASQSWSDSADKMVESYKYQIANGV